MPPAFDISPAIVRGLLLARLNAQRSLLLIGQRRVEIAHGGANRIDGCDQRRHALLRRVEPHRRAYAELQRDMRPEAIRSALAEAAFSFSSSSFCASLSSIELAMCSAGTFVNPAWLVHNSLMFTSLARACLNTSHIGVRERSEALLLDIRQSAIKMLKRPFHHFVRLRHRLQAPLHGVEP